jgi:hypothetical protein
MNDQNAVFAVLTEGMRKVRVSDWLPYDRAYIEWDRADRDPHPDVKFYAVRGQRDEIFGEADNTFEPELATPGPILGPPEPPYDPEGERGDYGKVSWRKLAPIHGFKRVADERVRIGQQRVLSYRRMCRCDVCGKEVPTLGISYHQQGGKGCLDRAAKREKR